MKNCLTCGVQFERARGDYCSQICYHRAYRKTPEGKAKRAEQHRRHMNKYPRKKAESLEKLNDYRTNKADEAFDRLVNPRCELDESYCNPDTEGCGKCGDVAEGCIWNSFRQKDPRQAAAQSG